MASRALVILLVFVFLLTFPSQAFAHPGRTDSRGCHTCKTNCTERWGIPYGFYHTHYPVRACGADSVTPTPTKKPTPKPTATLTPTPSPTPEPTVAGEATEGATPTPLVSPSEPKEADALTALLMLILLGGGTYWIIRTIRHRT